MPPPSVENTARHVSMVKPVAPGRKATGAITLSNIKKNGPPSSLEFSEKRYGGSGLERNKVIKKLNNVFCSKFTDSVKQFL